MTREQEILARAIGFADDDLILAAHAPHKKWRRAMPTLIAACLIVVIIAAFPFLRTVINVADRTENEAVAPGDGDPFGNESVDINTDAENLPIPGLGETATLGKTTLTMTALTETTTTFTVVKADNAPLYIAFRQYAGGVLGTTEPGFRDNGVIIRPYTIRLTIDSSDIIRYEFPYEAGTYTVTVDFSILRNGSYKMAESIIFYDYMTEDQTPRAQAFSLRIPAGAESMGESTPETTETDS